VHSFKKHESQQSSPFNKWVTNNSDETLLDQINEMDSQSHLFNPVKSIKSVKVIDRTPPEKAIEYKKIPTSNIEIDYSPLEVKEKVIKPLKYYQGMCTTKI
jgi:hypothetical protein